ncbi:MAG: sigma-70 family RNA polymerase sigma factor [Bryobacterales bacterium]|nr:sigma-70 family RNA polymerase sigma factor [Bryobacterales bacterium]
MSSSTPQLYSSHLAEEGQPLAGLTSTLYGTLRRIASRRLSGERVNHTLQVTALVHEAYLKLATVRERHFANEAHFLAVASRVMRQVLVDYARSRSTRKRAGGADESPSWTFEVAGTHGPELVDLLHLDSALAGLALDHEGLARLVEMRYFGGMTAEETAEALGISVHVVRHDLRFAHAWLRRKLNS